MTEHVQIEAVIRDRWGAKEVVYAGSIPEWAWDSDPCTEWRKAKRKMLLEARTTDPRGWRVTFREVKP